MILKAFDDLGKQPPAIHCLCLIGLKSWPMLDWKFQDYWFVSAGIMKGLDIGGDKQCNSITCEAITGQILERLSRLPKGTGDGIELVAKSLIENPIPRAEMEEEIARLAVEAHRSGRILISAEPGLTTQEARTILEKEYRRSLRGKATVAPRARWKDWLPLIAAFEDGEARHNLKTSQFFARYRRALDGLSFEVEPAPSVTTLPYS